MAKSLLGSNKALSSLKDEGLYSKAVQFRHQNAHQSELSTIDRALRNHDTSKAFNEQMHDREKDLAERIASSKNPDKTARLKAQHAEVTNNMNMSDDMFNQRRVAALADGGKTRKKEYAEAMKQPAKDLRRGVKSYYTDGDGWQKAARYGATGAALGTAAVGARYMTGGTATTNNRGQRDIAGIPFI